MLLVVSAWEAWQPCAWKILLGEKYNVCTVTADERDQENERVHDQGLREKKTAVTIRYAVREPCVEGVPQSLWCDGRVLIQGRVQEQPQNIENQESESIEPSKSTSAATRRSTERV